MFGGIGTADEKEQKRIERRRKDEEDRKARVLQDPRTLKMAVDTDFLAEQIRQKKEAKEAERKREMEEASAIRNTVTYLDQLESQRDRQKREEAAAVKNYNRTQSDLTQLRATFPRKVEPAPLLELGGQSGLRTFQGEDPASSERSRRQQQQLRDWSTQQSAEKEERMRQEREQQRLYAERTAQMDQTIFQMEQAQYQQKQAQLAADREFNRQLAEQKREKEMQFKVNETANNAEELKYHNTSDFMTENPATQIRTSSPNRVIPYAFKGLTPEQQEAIRQERELQIRQKELQKQREQEDQARWDQAQAQQGALLAERERIIASRQREVMQRLQEENQRTAQEQKERNAKRNAQLKSNQPTNDYFSQFGTSAR